MGVSWRSDQPEERVVGRNFSLLAFETSSLIWIGFGPGTSGSQYLWTLALVFVSVGFVPIARHHP